jgi:hypothetical protein
MEIASLGGMSPAAPMEPTPLNPKSGTGSGLGGGSATDGLGQINTGAQTVGSAIGRAAKALGTGAEGMKKGGTVKAKGGDWHGFGKSSSGNLKNY